MHELSIIECMPGYNGVNCSLLCPYPYFGVKCQRSCNCSRDLCDVSTGCIERSKGNYIFFNDHKNENVLIWFIFWY